MNGGVSGTSGPLALRACRAAAKASDGFNAIVDPANFRYNPDRDGYTNQSVSAQRSASRFAPEQELTAQYFRSRLNNQFDGGAGLRRSHDHRRRDVAGREPQPARAVLGVAAVGAAQGSTTAGSQTGVRRLPVQDHAAAVRVAERFHAAAGHADRRRSSGARSGSRPTPRSPSRRATPTRCSASTSCASTRTRCRPTCATTTRTSTAARRPASHRLRLSLRAGAGASRRATARASRRRRSTISTSPASPIPTSCPRRRGTSKAGVYWNGNVDARERRAARDRLPQPGVAAHRVPVRRRLQLRAAQRRNRATLEGVTLGLEARCRHGATLTASLDFQRRRTTSPASCCRGGRAGTAR